ncbi:MAG: hypothetical protein OJF51_000114 [Nitrospira sp.]|jgi:hypothetical protein|nr:MAG: hypothetical protein OJF51_000114 [Nitrospira sp.]
MSAAVENYNQLAKQQSALTKAIEESLNFIVSSLETKLDLAEQQKNLQGEIGIQYPEHSPADVQRYTHDVILRRLESRDRTQLRDWSIRLANAGGNLEE